MADTLNEWMEERKQQLITNYIQLGLRASGNWPNTLQSIVNELPFETRLKMKAAGYSQQMIQGRGQNKDQSKESIKAWVGWAGSTFLDQWVKYKNLNMSPFAVAYSIAKKGIVVPNRFNTGELMKGVITQSNLERLLRILGGETIRNLRDDIKPRGKTLV